MSGVFGEPVYKSGLFYPLLFICAVLTLYHFWIQSKRHVKLGNKIPGPHALPIVGNALEALMLQPDNVINYVKSRTDRFDRLFRAWLGHKLFVFLLNSDDAEIILSSHVHIEKSSEYDFFKPWLGEGLLISKGEKWHSHRKMIAPTFHSSILKTFIPLFNKNSQKVVERLRKEIGRTFDVHDHMSAITVEILLETAMGVEQNDEKDAGFEYAMAVMKMCNILHQRHYKFWLMPDLLFNLTSLAREQTRLLDIIHSLTKKVIKRKKNDYIERKKSGSANTYENIPKLSESTSCNYSFSIKDDLDENEENDIGEKRRLAFLDLLIEAAEEGKALSDNEIKEEVDTIMFEGHDTTAAASSFVLCLLGVHQDVQEKVYQELQEIFQSSDRPCTFLDTIQMKYLERVILETLRLYPPVPIIARTVREDVKLASGDYIIPANTTVVIGTFRIHRHPDYYENPEEFNPDNFLPEKCTERPYYSFIPFSAGPRSCVGRKYAMLKLKVLLSTILRNFKVRSKVEEKDFKLQGDIILKRSDGFTLEVEHRQQL